MSAKKTHILLPGDYNHVLLSIRRWVGEQFGHSKNFLYLMIKCAILISHRVESYDYWLRKVGTFSRLACGPKPQICFLIDPDAIFYIGVGGTAVSAIIIIRIL
jgi:hypothetical protein